MLTHVLFVVLANDVVARLRHDRVLLNPSQFTIYKSFDYPTLCSVVKCRTKINTVLVWLMLMMIITIR
jgi:hypothetical protein